MYDINPTEDAAVLKDSRGKTAQTKQDSVYLSSMKKETNSKESAKFQSYATRKENDFLLLCSKAREPPTGKWK